MKRKRVSFAVCESATVSARGVVLGRRITWPPPNEPGPVPFSSTRKSLLRSRDRERSESFMSAGPADLKR